MSDGRKRSKCECGVLKVSISYGSGSTNNLHKHIRTVHLSEQLEKKDNQVNLLLMKVSVCLLQLLLLLQPLQYTPTTNSNYNQSSMTQFVQKAMYFKFIFCSTLFHVEYTMPYK